MCTIPDLDHKSTGSKIVMMGGARLTTIADTTLVPLYSGVHDVVVSDMGDDVACQVTFCNP